MENKLPVFKLTVLGARGSTVYRLIFVHHAPSRTDEELEELEKIFSGDKVSFARIGDEIFL